MIFLEVRLCDKFCVNFHSVAVKDLNYPLEHQIKLVLIHYHGKHLFRTTLSSCTCKVQNVTKLVEEKMLYQFPCDFDKLVENMRTFCVISSCSFLLNTTVKVAQTLLVSKCFLKQSRIIASYVSCLPVLTKWQSLKHDL